MHARRSLQKLLAGLGLAAFVIGLAPGSAAALPLPGAKKPFNLFARAISFINVNRVYMGINTIGEVGVDSAGRGTVQGGYWPRGSADNYVFNSGLQVAGVVAGTKSAANPWGGDTTGGWFFDGAGGRQQTEAVTQAYQAFNAADAANWPADAFVPQGDDVANLYAQPLQGLVSASQGDVHFIAWEGNPAFNLNRTHPLGILVDYRLLAWNYPAGAQDIVFLVATVYNVTSSLPASYAQHRAGIRDLLTAQGVKFQQLNNAKFGIQLPAAGYTIGPAYMAVAGDNDVGTVGSNYNSAILPFAMGYTYDGPFGNNAAGWKFDPSLFGPPFFAGIGFVGYKYLKGPDGPGVIGLMTTFCNGGAVCTGHADPADEKANYRLLAGTPSSADGQCNITSPGLTQAQIHFCFMLTGPVGADTRMAESSAPLTLAPGEAKTIVVAYVYAAPVAIPGFTPVNTVTHPPGNPTWSNSTDSMFKYNSSGSPGLNQVDSISGFLAYNGPHFNTDGSVHVPIQSEFSVVKGSLLGKALVAQAVFDNKFLQEFAPEAPDFFLIPGDKQVTVLWKPSRTETVGDPYFQVVKSPTQLNSAGQTVANPLYDPNYRQFDVEGYRVYRGRSDTPSALRLLIQYDYAGTTYKDYTGGVFSGNCAPELGIGTDCPIKFPTPVLPTPSNLSPSVPPGTAYTQFASYNIGPQPSGAPFMFVDISVNPRVALLGGTTSLSQVVDTTVVSGGGGFPALTDGGVPFIFVDKVGAVGCTGCGVNNGINYYYTVTAFDVNAPGHGPTSLESAKVTKQVTPQAASPDQSIVATTGNGVFGRGSSPLTDNVMPTIDSVTGKFSKKFPPSTALVLSLASLPQQILSGSGAASIRYDSTQIVSAVTSGSVNVNDWFTGGTTKISVPQSISATTGTTTGGSTFPALALDSALSSVYGGGAGYAVAGAFTYQRQGTYVSGLWGRGCANTGIGPVPPGKTGTPCYFYGPRWFNGDQETQNNPNVTSPVTFLTGATVASNWSNGGSLTGVATIYIPSAYGMFTGSQYRDMELLLSPFATASDYRLYWGAAGKVDSVIDLTYNTVVPFKTTIGSSWGILNSAAATVAGSYDGTAAVTASDFACVAPLSSYALASMPSCTVTDLLANTAVPGPIAYAAGDIVNMKVANGKLSPAANAGFGLYIKGRIFLFELTGGALPAAGTAWTMRDYIGGIYGGNGTDPACATLCQFGTYAYNPPTPAQVGGVTPPVTAGLPFTAPGASVQYTFNVANTTLAMSNEILAKVHTVPDPYYVTSAFDIAVNSKDIQFVNVPVGATIRIYSSSGVLIRVLQNTSTQFGGLVHWNVRNRTNQFVASGVYFYSVTSGTSSYTGRMTIVNYASTVQ